MNTRDGDPDISIMKRADIPFALQMTDAEMWGYTKADFENLIDFEPAGCFVARAGGHPVGIVSSTSYGRYAFVGTLIVDGKHRNTGIGEMLLRRAMTHLRDKGVTTIELDGVFRAAPLYRRLGFKDKYLSLRFFRPPGGARADGASLVPEPADDIIEFDLQRTGIERGRVLRRFLEQYRDAAYLIRDGDPAAYAFVRPRGDGTAAVGPLVSVDEDTAERLVAGLAATYAGVGLSVGVPDTRRSMAGLLLDLGFMYGAPSLRMYWGERKDYETHVYGILSPEKG